MYVFNGGVHHATRATGDGIERRFKERSEDGWRDFAPVELRCADEELAEVVRNWGYVAFGCIVEQPAVRVGECAKLRFEINIAFIERRVQYFKQLLQSLPQKRCGGVLHEATEAVFREDVGVLGVEAEHKSHAKAVQRG